MLEITRFCLGRDQNARARLEARNRLVSALVSRGAPALEVLDAFAAAFFRLVEIFMRAAPIGAFGAFAFTVGKYGVASIASLATLVATFYGTSAFFVVVVLGAIAALNGFSILKLIRYLRAELLLVLGTSSSEAALPSLMQKLERAGCDKPVVGLVVLRGEEILGVGRYDRLDDPVEAEVAFNISDASQGKGIGSILMEHLAVAARPAGDKGQRGCDHRMVRRAETRLLRQRQAKHLGPYPPGELRPHLRAGDRTDQVLVGDHRRPCVPPAPRRGARAGSWSSWSGYGVPRAGRSSHHHLSRSRRHT